MITVFDVQYDRVIKSAVATSKADYRFALERIFPLLDRFDEQRKSQSKSFYSRLRKDIIAGCIMPPITLAFVSKENAKNKSVRDLQEFIDANISQGYVLDGMQRLNTLKDASEDPEFEPNRPILINVIIAEKYDLLLYRMITLNNGQKPMTARHQIEMLTKGALDLSETNLKIVTEKDTEKARHVGAFKKSNIVEAYIAYLTDSVNNKNSKIIESKLDEILVGKVMDSELTDEVVEFSDILKLIEKLSENDQVKDWLRVPNNLIGFCVGVKISLPVLMQQDLDEIQSFVSLFDQAFHSINPSKVNVGKYRRELARYYFESYELFINRDREAIEAAFFDRTLTE